MAPHAQNAARSDDVAAGDAALEVPVAVRPPHPTRTVNTRAVLAAAGQAAAIIAAGVAAASFSPTHALLTMIICAVGGSTLTMYAFDRARDALGDARALLAFERKRAAAHASRAEQQARLERAARDALIIRLAKMGSRHDADPEGHHDRLEAYSTALARALVGWFPEIDQAWIDRLSVACRLHDIGQSGVDHAILLKPTRLTPGERREMQKHPLIGADTLMEIRRQFGDDPLVNMGVQIALSHHERWDGHGYPYGLVADQIAPAARIVALADVYDALTSARVYKSAMGHDEAVETIRSGAGTQFDPAVVEAFEKIAGEFNRIRLKYAPQRREGAGYDAARALAA